MDDQCKICGAPVNLAPDGDPRYEAPIVAAIDEIERLREGLEYIATYRNGFDATDAGRRGLYAHNLLAEINTRK